MTSIRELSISSIGEPAHVRIEKNSKGYNYELSLHGENTDYVLAELFAARRRIEQELGISMDDAAKRRKEQQEFSLCSEVEI